MTTRELIGYVLAAAVLLFHVGMSTITTRLDWLAFGPRIQADQERIVQAINALAADLNALKQGRGPAPTNTPIQGGTK